ncbi:hypothetical protein HETIRDRAFT_163716 [Heterobasidion irregulare TC 32-1]|uniref:Uncharacterized protein n=1 Tax=Heterobasidion irregulare (strain TC 32-1) TaxID=747525 RepID=W4JW05_HETIT|nr:uncharacterized protein HETIRDRAFT_163716 [Heterobasidion irregulare TC 32-1]ETW77732.1 hypothetical protein HETIRDRAFT_163716 [Heterobasidion irregulare TC 32-1]
MHRFAAQRSESAPSRLVGVAGLFPHFTFSSSTSAERPAQCGAYVAMLCSSF